VKNVSVFFGGVQKGGTTTLHSYMAEHPDLSPPDRKEPHHFDDEGLDWNAPDHGAYHAMYAPDDDRMRYDGTPIHAFWPPSLARIRAYNAQARLIFLFRDPFARAWSHWCMEWARGADDLPFAEAIRKGRARLPDDLLDPAWRVYSYVERGRYGVQVARALALFPRKQMLFLKTEDLARDHAGVLAQIAQFLGIAPFVPGPARREHERPQVDYPAKPSERDRALIRAELAGDTALVARLTGLDTAEWFGAI